MPGWRSLSLPALALAVGVAAWTDGDTPALAICALSFWHYYLYWLAYRYGAVPMADFQRDAVAAKTVSLLALGYAYFTAPPDLVSLAVVGGGFLLNAVAARALGRDRTYYGYELGGVPQQHVTAFPYSWIPHPMLLGNMAAFGGTLLNAGFCEQWWPLAGAHVGLNLGLLVMEAVVTPLRGTVPPATRHPLPATGLAAAAGAAAGAAGASLADAALWTGAVVGAAAGAHATVMYFWYSSPPSKGGIP
ncbi:MAG: hypothetical protein EBS65_14025 [Betaproteobacteria bacterium]|nr:hypothetical protein [Betaproteobacteria bacterium]